MKHETVIKLLREKGFENFQLESAIMTQFEQHNISIWASETKLVLVKEYRTKTSLINWKLEDQIYISTALQYFPTEYINNLYFFMVLDFNSDEINLRLEINKIEKNDLVSKKYVIKNIEDLNRIPFLTTLNIETKEFAFDKKFKERIVKFKDECVGEEKVLNLELILDDYFINYSKEKQISLKKIETLLETGD